MSELQAGSGHSFENTIVKEMASENRIYAGTFDGIELEAQRK